MQKKKSLLEVENEALRERTQELEVAKQVLQTEVDKVFSKEVPLPKIFSVVICIRWRYSVTLTPQSGAISCRHPYTS